MQPPVRSAWSDKIWKLKANRFYVELRRRTTEYPEKLEVLLDKIMQSTKSPKFDSAKCEVRRVGIKVLKPVAEIVARQEQVAVRP